MTRTYLLAILAAGTMLAGCATPLSPTQKSELDVYRTKGLEVQEKNPTTGAALGILPGGGSFYTRNYGLGVVNLLFWPISILWDPISGHDGAESINYFATKEVLDKKHAGDIAALETKLAAKSITPEQYLIEKGRIDKKYAPEI